MIQFGQDNKQMVFVRRLILTILLALPATPTMADGDSLIGDWEGSRKRLTEKGAKLNNSYIGDWNTKLSGTTSTVSTDLDHAVVAEAGVDDDKTAGKGADFQISVPGNQGSSSSPSNMVSDAQGITSIEAPNKWQVDVAWYAQQSGDRFANKPGIHDLNGDLDVVDTAGPLLNGAHGIGTTISQTGPPLFADRFPAVFPGYNMNNGRYLQTAYLVPTNFLPNDTMLGIEHGITTENTDALGAPGASSVGRGVEPNDKTIPGLRYDSAQQISLHGVPADYSGDGAGVAYKNCICIS